VYVSLSPSRCAIRFLTPKLLPQRFAGLAALGRSVLNQIQRVVGDVVAGGAAQVCGGEQGRELRDGTEVD